MSKERLYIFDTTLRDGAQTQGVDFSIEDKDKIASALDNLGVDYIEGGWPGANPTDTEFFQKKHNFKKCKTYMFWNDKKIRPKCRKRYRNISIDELKYFSSMLSWKIMGFSC